MLLKGDVLLPTTKRGYKPGPAGRLHMGASPLSKGTTIREYERIESEDKCRRFDGAKTVVYEAAAAYAEQAEARGHSEVDPLVRALLLGVAMGQTVTELARKLGLPRRTASDLVARAMR